MPEENNGAESTSSLDSAVSNESSAQNDNSANSSLDTSAGNGAVATGEEAQPLNEFQLESEISQFESDIQTALDAVDEEKDPEFYRNSLKQYGKYTKDFRAQLEPYKAFQGVITPEQLPDTVAMLTALNNRRMVDGVPKPDVSQFTELFLKNHGDIAEDVIRTLGARQVPGSDMNYFATALKQQYGIEPTQLEAVKAYLESNTIPEVPPEFADAYRRLTPKLKEEFTFLDKETQQEVLEREQRDLDKEKGSQTEKGQQQQRFVQEVESAAENRYLQGAQNAMDAFAKTLEKATFSTDPQVNELIIEENLQLVLNALNPYSAGYQRARAAVTKIGVQLDETRVNGILDTLAEESRNIEYFTRTNNASQAKTSEAKYARSLQELIAQGHKIAGQILKVRGQGVQASAQEQANLLQQTNGRPVISGNSIAGGNAQDWIKNMGQPGTPEYRRKVAELNSAQNSG